jgi:RNA polymerase sigma-70 factor (ECF subfamily)
MTASACQRDIVATAVESLSPEHRQILVEAYFRRRTVTETAHTLGLPIPVVKRRLYHALRELRRSLAAEGLPVNPTTSRDPMAA